jgi:DNA-nicking Smr family endonuclease
MAKRAKAKDAVKRPKAEQAEPFFRPFAKLSRSPTPSGDGGKRNAAAPAAQPPGREGSAPKKASATERAPRPPQHDAPLPASAAPRLAPLPASAAPRLAPLPIDSQTFAIYMAGVRALPGGAGHRIPRSASERERASGGRDGDVGASGPAVDAGDADARARMRSLVSEGLRFETVDDGERIEGRRIDVDPREVRRLRRGQFAVDGRLDLHGLGADEARHAVEVFVRKRAHDGDRVVLVVHGKGTHSPRGNAVLRGEIAAWLSQGRSARHVAAFTTAPDEDGGTGAVLVLLAR